MSHSNQAKDDASGQASIQLAILGQHLIGRLVKILVLLFDQRINGIGQQFMILVLLC
ncbi:MULTISPECIES: hypothetical protein [Thiorhodovibrio]|uniref:hypothetical protein n=1 Tax=Thiorhodovibrio TaxID=61593 RepID=UPI001912D7E9|nr:MULTISPECIES: hypothetical protein [Thiorhodovibrio]WPL14020.1 hypothetical protein Thiosp_03851 [Thiorhodovibrio litoralis]